MNFKQWVNLQENIVSIHDLPSAILQTLQFTMEGKWSIIKSNIHKASNLFRLHGNVKFRGQGVKSTDDIFNLYIRYRLTSDDFSYDSIKGSDGLKIGANLYGWRPGIKIINPYNTFAPAPNDLGKKLSAIIDSKTGEVAEIELKDNLKTPYGVIQWTKYWINVFYSQDDGDDDPWQDDKPDPSRELELVPVRVRRYK